MLEAAMRALERTTALRVHVLDYEPGPRNADALLEIETPDKRYPFLAEVKVVDRFETPSLVKARGAGGAPPPILVAPYITRQTAEYCKELQLPFIDTAGNAYIQAEGLMIYVVGQHRPIDLHHDRFRGLTAAGLQLTFTFLCRPDLLNTTYRAIAAAANVALGTVGPAMKDLQNRKFLQVGQNGKARICDYRKLLEEWVTRYPTTLRPKLKPRRFQADPHVLNEANLQPHQAFWGGEAAADRLTHMLRPALFIIYAAGPWQPLAAAYRMRAHPDGNVEVLDAFWNFTLEDQQVDLAPPPLIYADLMATKDGRNMEVANLINERFIEPNLHHAR